MSFIFRIEALIASISSRAPLVNRQAGLPAGRRRVVLDPLVDDDDLESVARELEAGQRLETGRRLSSPLERGDNDGEERIRHHVSGQGEPAASSSPCDFRYSHTAATAANVNKYGCATIVWRGSRSNGSHVTATYAGTRRKGSRRGTTIYWIDLRP